jgi:hypothetical protein
MATKRIGILTGGGDIAKRRSVPGLSEHPHPHLL